jgi:hypothetical protein
MTEPTVGRVVKHLESLDGAPARVGPFVMRWGATLSVDPDSGAWTVESRAEWTT